MHYTPSYFDFHKLEHIKEVLDVFLLVGIVYAVIFTASILYKYLGPR